MRLVVSSQDRSVLAAAARVWQRQAKERGEPWVTSEDVNEEMGIDVDQPVVEDALKRLERDGYIMRPELNLTPGPPTGERCEHRMGSWGSRDDGTESRVSVWRRRSRPPTTPTSSLRSMPA
jgi:hypothetical protein